MIFYPVCTILYENAQTYGTNCIFLKEKLIWPIYYRKCFYFAAAVSNYVTIVNGPLSSFHSMLSRSNPLYMYIDARIPYFVYRIIVCVWTNVYQMWYKRHLLFIAKILFVGLENGE